MDLGTIAIFLHGLVAFSFSSSPNRNCRMSGCGATSSPKALPTAGGIRRNIYTCNHWLSSSSFPPTFPPFAHSLSLLLSLSPSLLTLSLHSNTCTHISSPMYMYHCWPSLPSSVISSCVGPIPPVVKTKS